MFSSNRIPCCHAFCWCVNFFHCILPAIASAIVHLYNCFPRKFRLLYFANVIPFATSPPRCVLHLLCHPYDCSTTTMTTAANLYNRLICPLSLRPSLPSISLPLHSLPLATAFPTDASLVGVFTATKSSKIASTTITFLRHFVRYTTASVSPLGGSATEFPFVCVPYHHVVLCWYFHHQRVVKPTKPTAVMPSPRHHRTPRPPSPFTLPPHRTTAAAASLLLYRHVWHPPSPVLFASLSIDCRLPLLLNSRQPVVGNQCFFVYWYWSLTAACHTAVIELGPRASPTRRVLSSLVLVVLRLTVQCWQFRSARVAVGGPSGAVHRDVLYIALEDPTLYFSNQSQIQCTNVYYLLLNWDPPLEYNTPKRGGGKRENR